MKVPTLENNSDRVPLWPSTLTVRDCSGRGVVLSFCHAKYRAPALESKTPRFDQPDLLLMSCVSLSKLLNVPILSLPIYKMGSSNPLQSSWTGICVVSPLPTHGAQRYQDRKREEDSHFSRVQRN